MRPQLRLVTCDHIDFGRVWSASCSQRLLAVAASADRHDRALWTPIAAETGGAGNSTALVGTPETVA